MTSPLLCRLGDRGLIAVTGPDAEPFLGRLLTQSPSAATAGHAAYGALLTPQGKIISDFLIARLDDGFLLDGPASATADIVRRLTMFKLRAAVTIADVTGERAALAAWDGNEPPADGGPWFVDSRAPGLGYRAWPRLDTLPAMTADDAAYDRHRIALAVPAIGRDAALGDGFPADIAMDSLAGVDFAKGCYVGQEVVSRMRYRGTARRRPVAVTGEAPLRAGADILAGTRAVGAIGSVADRRGIAIVRLDRVAAARAAGEPITADGQPVSLDLPAWADYGWPENTSTDD